MDKCFLGIDTSNYKTSLSILDDNGLIVFNKSEFLEVKIGEKGLRQSDAFFKHSNILPQYLNEAFQCVDPSDIKAIGVSNKPRNLESSYMPCFLAGQNLAKELSYTLSIPLYEFSHQEGHIAAVLEQNNVSECIFCHFSGGTSEILLCTKNNSSYVTHIIGGTKDISIGQLLDRIGVKLGYSFPSGRYLDDIASSNDYFEKYLSQIVYNDGYFNLSGLETKVLRLIEQLPDDEIDILISELFYRLSELIFNNLICLSSKYNISNIFLAGGVGASKTLRKHITFLSDKELLKFTDKIPKIIFADSQLCGDNAIGISLLCRRLYTNANE